MSNNLYDILKNLALILAPIVTLIMALLQAFDIVDNETGIAVASAIDTFLGAIVVVAKQIYDDKQKKNKKKKKGA
jgi:fumarate reductase subunit D